MVDKAGKKAASLFCDERLAFVFGWKGVLGGCGRASAHHEVVGGALDAERASPELPVLVAAPGVRLALRRADQRVELACARSRRA